MAEIYNPPKEVIEEFVDEVRRQLLDACERGLHVVLTSSPKVFDCGNGDHLLLGYDYTAKTNIYSTS